MTGGIAAGKSTVAKLLADQGFTVVDADRLVAELYRPGGAGAAVVDELFGADFLDASGAVDRKRVAERIFADPEARQRLEARIHPLVRERFAEIAATAQGSAVLEATLLVEAGYAPDFDLVVTVEASDALRRERAIARGLSPTDADARQAALGGGEQRRAAAHRVIENEGSREDLERQVEDLAQEIRRIETRTV